MIHFQSSTPMHLLHLASYKNDESLKHVYSSNNSISNIDRYLKAISKVSKFILVNLYSTSCV